MARRPARTVSRKTIAPPAGIADRRAGARLVCDAPCDATCRLVRRTKRQRDAHARGRWLGPRRAAAHCCAGLVVGPRRHRRLCRDPDDVRGGSGPLYAPAPRTSLTLATVKWGRGSVPMRTVARVAICRPEGGPLECLGGATGPSARVLAW
jgi:hypothetical protein